MRYELLTARNIIERHFGVDLDVKGRESDRIQARQYYFKWARENTTASYKYISCTLHMIKPHHTSIISAINRFDGYFETDKKYRQDYWNICAQISRATKQTFDEENLVLNAS